MPYGPASWPVPEPMRMSLLGSATKLALEAPSPRSPVRSPVPERGTTTQASPLMALGAACSNRAIAERSDPLRG